MFRVNLKKILQKLMWGIPQKELSLGNYITTGVLTNGAGDLYFCIPLNRVYPPDATISKITFNIVVRAGNRNGSGMYIVKNAADSSALASFSSTNTFTFYNGNNDSKSITATNFVITLQGGSNIWILLRGSSIAQYLFASNSTINGYINNQPCTVWLADIKISFNYF